MSEFIAEARVAVLPDLSKFRSELQAELLAATASVKPVAIPVVPVATTGAQVAAQRQLSAGAVELAGAEAQVTRATKDSTAALIGAGTAAGRLDAALLGLRTIAGSTAVIGLGALALAAIAAGKAIRASIAGAASLEQELNVFRVTAGATADEMAQVSKAAQDLGKDITLPAVTSTDAAIAFTELAKAGLDVQNALEGGRGVLQLSAAAQIDFASAAELTANALNAFQLAGTQAVHVADLLANASIAAQGSIEDMGLALQQSAAVANQLGLSVETTVAFIAELAKAGIQGSDAGTSLRVALTRLIAPTKDAQALLHKFGIALRDVQGNLRTDVFVQLGRAMEGLSKQQQARDLFVIFGQDAQRAAAVLSRDTLPALNETISAMEKQGSAAELAGARNVGFAGKLSALQSSLQTLGTSLGSLATGPLGTAAEALTTLANDAVLAKEKLDALSRSAEGTGGGVGSFLSQLDRVSFLNFGDLQDQITATFEVLREDPRRAVTSEFSAVKVLEELRRQAELTSEALPSVRGQITDLFLTFQKGGGRGSATALNEFVLGLQKLSQEEKTGLVTNEQLAASIDALIRDLQGADFTVPVGIQLDRAGLKTTASEGAGILLNELTSDLSPEAGRAIGFGLMAGVGEGVTEGAQQAAAAAADAASLLSRNIALAEAGGNQSNLLNLLRERERRQQAFLTRILARPQTQANVDLARRAAEQLARTRDQIQQILDQQARDTEAAAKDAQSARDKADQALLDMFGGRITRAENRLIQAQATKTLADDLAAQKALLTLLTRELIAIQNTVRDAKLRAQQIAAVTRQMIQVGQDIQRTRQAQKEALKAAAEQRQQLAEESIQLDISLAQTTGNVRAEIAARERLIALLRRQQRTVRRGTLEYKRLRNEIAEQIAAIKELEKTKRQETDAFKRMTFEFLQTQTDFVSNLLGNLIPGGATGGLVGGTTPATPRPAPVGAQVQRAATAQEARAIRGPTLGQANDQIGLLRSIRDELRRLTARITHPETKKQASVGRAVGDYEHGSPGM